MKKYLYITLLLNLFFCSSAFAADDELATEIKLLKDQLKQQQEMIKQQQKAIEILESNLNKQIKQQENEIAKIKSAPANSVKGDIKITMKPTPSIQSSDGKYSFQPLGRIHTDYAFFDDDKTDHPDGATFRRARVGFKGTADKDVNYKFELDFGNKDADDSASFKDVYLEYTGLEDITLKAGNFKPAYGLEELTSSNYITFIERSLPTGSFATGEIIGLQARGNGEKHSWAVGVHNDASTSKSNDDEAWSIATRVTGAPILEQNNSLHLGASAAHRVPDSATDSVAFDTTAENSIQRRESAETGNITNVKSVELAGLEAAWTYKNISLQSEYFHTIIDRDNASNINLTGWYGQASWIPTGETRPYDVKKGSFGRIIPKSPFSLKDGGIGAWELAVRYSNLDLNDIGSGTQGGGIDDITFGVNWYLNPYIRLMANYIIADTDQVTPSGNNVAPDDDPKILLLRAAVDF